MRTSTRFELDEEKILREKEYDLDAIYRAIDEVATKRAKLTKIGKNHYEYHGDSAPAYVGIFVFNHMVEHSWFTKNLKSWEWIDEDEGVDDLIAMFKEDGDGVWA